MTKKLNLWAFSLFILFVLFLSALFSANASALGISPSKNEINFVPGMEASYEFLIKNSKDEKVNVDIYVRGDLNEYILPGITSMVLGPNEKASFTVSMKLPNSIEKPGVHSQRVGVIESMSNIGVNTGVGVGARVGVESLFNIRVPYPGKYAEMKVTAGDVKVGDPAKFYITVYNYGKEQLESIQANINIIDSKNKKIDKISSEIISLKPSESREILVEWPTTGIQSGIYKAEVVVSYDNKEIKETIEFRVGELLAKIVNIKYDKVAKNSVAKFNIDIESYWNSEIKNAYLTLDVFSGPGNSMANRKSESFDMSPWSKRTVNLLWDTAGINPGTYDAKLTLYYADKTSESPFKIKIGSNNSIMWVIAIITVVMLLYLILRKRQD